VTTIVLASASPARLAVLRGAGLEPEVVVSGVDESAFTAATPAKLADLLAQAKAAAVASGRADGLVIGCDFATRPGPARAGQTRLGGRGRRSLAGDVGTDGDAGHRALRDQRGHRPARRGGGGDQGPVRHPVGGGDRAYVASGEPLAVAGAFTLDGRGGWFVDGIEGDHGTVLGVSLPLLRRLLADLGISLTSLWA